MERFFMGIDDIILDMARNHPAFVCASVEKKQEVEKELFKKIESLILGQRR